MPQVTGRNAGTGADSYYAGLADGWPDADNETLSIFQDFLVILDDPGVCSGEHGFDRQTWERATRTHLNALIAAVQMGTGSHAPPR